MKRSEVRGSVVLSCVLLLSGCAFTPGSIRVSAVMQARAGLDEPQIHAPIEEEEVPERGGHKPSGSPFLGTLLAFFPGLIVPGTGHYYAGDYHTASRLLRVGELGYLMALIGGGIGVGGYYLDRAEDKTTFAYTLYGTGGVIGVCGLGFILSAWIYDMVDTPRAVRTGGAPPPRSEFIEALDVFD